MSYLKGARAGSIAGLPGSTLKIAAVIAMLIDHVGAVILEGILKKQGILDVSTAEELTAFLTDHQVLYWANSICRIIGRIAFPLFCFLLVQGFLHTHSRAKYLRNLLLFAVLSEVPFDLAMAGRPMDLSYQNVFFTLAVGLGALWLLDLAEKRFTAALSRSLMTALICLGACILALLLRSDYSMWGVLVIILMYMFRIKPMTGALIGCIALAVVNMNELPALFALPLIRKYNGERGLSMKYAFYAFYPAHLLALWGLWLLIGRGIS